MCSWALEDAEWLWDSVYVIFMCHRKSMEPCDHRTEKYEQALFNKSIVSICSKRILLQDIHKIIISTIFQCSEMKLMNFENKCCIELYIFFMVITDTLQYIVSLLWMSNSNKKCICTRHIGRYERISIKYECFYIRRLLLFIKWIKQGGSI